MVDLRIRMTVAKVLLELYYAIKAFGDDGIPSGILYANLMGVMSYDSYTKAIQALVDAKMISNKDHLLKALS